MPAAEKPALSALVSPRSLDEFFAGFTPSKAGYFVSQGNPARLPAFLRAKELQSCEALARVNSGAVWQSNGPRSSYMMPIDKRTAEFVYKMGLTVYFTDVTNAVPGAQAFVRQLEADLGLNPGACRMTAWASPSENGAACHYDAHDIISIQLRGTKQFELAPVAGLRNPYGTQYSAGATRPDDEAFPQMAGGFPASHDADFRALVLEPGSVLFFPRATWHRTYASGDSLAVAFVLEPPSAADCVLRQLRYVLLQDAKWRQPLYGAWGDGPEQGAAFEKIAELTAELPDLARVIKPEHIALALLPEDMRLEKIDRLSRFQRIPDVTIATEPVLGEAGEASPPGVRIVRRPEDGSEETLANLKIPRQALEVLGWLVERDAAFGVDELAAAFPDIPFDGLKKLLKSCAKGGLLRLLWFPAIERPEPGS
ncbi:MAG TPA: cupin domain-containing protein [Kiloniellales bacterium]